MTKTDDFPTRIYTDVLDQIHGVISTLDQETFEDRLNEEQNTARDVLRNVEQKLHELIKELQQNAEWKTFTIAFYGETNAGKSTLIECLRILFKESSKMKQRKDFHALQKQFGLYENDLQMLEQQAEKFERRLADIQEEVADAEQQYGQQEAELAQQASVLRQQIAEKKRVAGFLKRLLFIARKLPEETVLHQIQRQAAKLPEQHAGVLERLQQQRQQAQASREGVMRQHQMALDNRHQLEAFEDGLIIGDGRSDFTREMHSYTFDVRGQSFTVLDVPGIEGSEAEVNDHIQKAVKRAHAVFYVTSKAAPPQTGEEGQPGTLEKIKAHIGAQTEVWTLFNKRVTNPMALRKPTLISADEQTSLADLDSKMRETLGRHYRRSVSLCALPAFLAVADCLTPLSSKALSRKKFFDVMTSHQLLKSSGVENFQQLLTQDLTKDYNARIRRSNLNKITVAIDNTCIVMEQLRNEQFLPLQADLHKEAEYAERQLDMAQDNLKKGVNEIGRRAIMKFGARVRQQIYAQIEDDITNEDFESKLYTIMEQEQCTIQDGLPELFDKKVKQFQKQVAGIIDRFEEHSKDILVCYEQLNQAKVSNEFSIDVSMDKGINLYGLITSFVGGALMLWTPVGWVVMSIGAITLLTGLFKSIWGFFSDDYRKSQQRKAAEKNIRKAYKELSVAFRQSQRDALQPLVDKIDDIKGLLWAPVVQTEQVCTMIDAANSQLKLVASGVNTQEVKR